MAFGRDREPVLKRQRMESLNAKEEGDDNLSWIGIQAYPGPPARIPGTQDVLPPSSGAASSVTDPAMSQGAPFQETSTVTATGSTHPSRMAFIASDHPTMRTPRSAASTMRPFDGERLQFSTTAAAVIAQGGSLRQTSPSSPDVMHGDSTRTTTNAAARTETSKTRCPPLDITGWEPDLVLEQLYTDQRRGVTNRLIVGQVDDILGLQRHAGDILTIRDRRSELSAFEVTIDAVTFVERMSGPLCHTFRHCRRGELVSRTRTTLGRPQEMFRSDRDGRLDQGNLVENSHVTRIVSSGSDSPLAGLTAGVFGVDTAATSSLQRGRLAWPRSRRLSQPYRNESWTSWRPAGPRSTFYGRYRRSEWPWRAS